MTKQNKTILSFFQTKANSTVVPLKQQQQQKEERKQKTKRVSQSDFGFSAEKKLKSSSASKIDDADVIILGSEVKDIDPIVIDEEPVKRVEVVLEQSSSKRQTIQVKHLKQAVPHYQDTLKQEEQLKTAVISSKKWSKVEFELPSFVNNHVDCCSHNLPYFVLNHSISRTLFVNDFLYTNENFKYTVSQQYQIDQFVDMFAVQNEDLNSFKYLTDPAIQFALSDPNPDKMLWVDKFQPGNMDELLIDVRHKSKIKFLEKWFQSYKETSPVTSIESSVQSISDEQSSDDLDDLIVDDDVYDDDYQQSKRKSKKKKKKRVKKQRIPYEESLYNMNGDIKSFQELLKNQISQDSNQIKNISTVMLYSPNSSLKTQIVYTAAKQFNFDVIEINAGNTRRSGQDLLAIVGESLKSHNVQRNWGQQQQQSGIMNFFGQKAKYGSSFQDKQCSNAPKQKKDSLIFIKDVNILFNQDLNFWNTILDFVKVSSSPIVLSTSDLTYLPQNVADCIDQYGSKMKLIALDVNKDIIPEYIQACLYSQGLMCSQNSLVEKIKSLNYNLKSILNYFNFLTRTCTINNYHESNIKTDQIEDDNQLDVKSKLLESDVAVICEYTDRKAFDVNGPYQTHMIDCEEIEKHQDLFCDRTYIFTEAQNEVELNAYQEMSEQICKSLNVHKTEKSYEREDLDMFKPISPLQIQSDRYFYEDHVTYTKLILDAFYNRKEGELSLLSEIDSGLRRSSRAVATRKQQDLETYFQQFLNHMQYEKDLMEVRALKSNDEMQCDGNVTII